eukprot:1153816-Pelagomonas_calceolata.AAC.7
MKGLNPLNALDFCDVEADEDRLGRGREAQLKMKWLDLLDALDFNDVEADEDRSGRGEGAHLRMSGV